MKKRYKKRRRRKKKKRGKENAPPLTHILDSPLFARALGRGEYQTTHKNSMIKIRVSTPSISNVF